VLASLFGNGGKQRNTPKTQSAYFVFSAKSACLNSSLGQRPRKKMGPPRNKR